MDIPAPPPPPHCTNPLVFSHPVQGYQIGTFLNDIIEEIEVFSPPYPDRVFKYFVNMEEEEQILTDPRWGFCNKPFIRSGLFRENKK